MRDSKVLMSEHARFSLMRFARSFSIVRQLHNLLNSNERSLKLLHWSLSSLDDHATSAAPAAAPAGSGTSSSSGGTSRSLSAKSACNT